MLDGNKPCTLCLKIKSLDSFYVRNVKKDPVSRPECKECSAIERKRYRKENYVRVSRYNSHWKKNNRGKAGASWARYQATKMLATPSWLTSEQFSQIVDIYEEAAQIQQMYSTPLHVDHIVPLRGKDVCGLHVPWNLQILPARDNESKGNR